MVAKTDAVLVLEDVDVLLEVAEPVEDRLRIDVLVCVKEVRGVWVGKADRVEVRVEVGVKVLNIATSASSRFSNSPLLSPYTRVKNKKNNENLFIIIYKI